jgi:hypothetical protein
MHPLFEIVERRGILDSRVAALMGMTSSGYAHAKLGKRRVQPRHRRAAVEAMRFLEQLRTDGQPFTEADLFHDDLVPAVTNTATQVA